MMSQPLASALRQRLSCTFRGRRPAVSIAVSVLSAAFSGCTLTGDGFEPTLLSGLDDAGVARAVGVDAGGVVAGEAALPSCASELVSACLGRADEAAPASADEAPPSPALDVAAARPPLSAPRCTGVLGPFGAPERVVGIEFEGDVFGPFLSRDGRTLYFSAYVEEEQQIYSAARDAPGAEFSRVIELSTVGSEAMDGSPFLTADGRRLYFFSDRAGGVGSRDIWVSDIRVGDDSVSELGPDDFSAPTLVAGLNSGAGDLLPWLTEDELTVYFVSGRPGGRGAADIWRAQRQSRDEPFEAPTNVEDLSSGANEGRVVLSADGRTAFFSSSRGGGPPDLWTATRPGDRGPFFAPERLEVLNSNASELDVMLSSDETELFFASTREGASSLWRATRPCLEREALSR